MPDNHNDKPPSWLSRVPWGCWVLLGSIVLIYLVMNPAALGVLGCIGLVIMIVWVAARLVRRGRTFETKPAGQPGWTDPQHLLPDGSTLDDLERVAVWITQHTTDDKFRKRCDFDADRGPALAVHFPSYTLWDEQDDMDTGITLSTFVLHREFGPSLAVRAAIREQVVMDMTARYRSLRWRP